MKEAGHPGKPRLLGFRGGAPIGEWPLATTGWLQIGRSRQCNVVLDDETVSRMHLEIRPLAGGGWEAVDLGSSSGTSLNGKRVKQQRLRSGDRLRVGATEFLAVDLEPAPEEPVRSPRLPPPLPEQTAIPAARPATNPFLWIKVALAASVLVVATGVWLLVGGLRSRGFVAGRSTTVSYPGAAAQAMLAPAADGAVGTTPLGSFTTTATGGRLEHAEITLEVPAGALPDGTRVTVARVDAAPVAMRDSFPVARLGDFTPLSAILRIEPGTDALSRAATVSFPLASGVRFTSLMVVTWNPATGEWEMFPARFDAASGRATGAVSHLRFIHLLGLEEGN